MAYDAYSVSSMRKTSGSIKYSSHYRLNNSFHLTFTSNNPLAYFSLGVAPNLLIWDSKKSTPKGGGIDITPKRGSICLATIGDKEHQPHSNC